MAVMRMLRSLCLIGLAFTTATAAAWTAENSEKPPEIKPEKAREYVGKKVTVTMAVKKAKYSQNRNTVFLDSESDFKDPSNLAVIIEGDTLKKFKEAGISAPADNFRDKTIRATGQVELREGRPYIPITAVSDIEIKNP